MDKPTPVLEENTLYVGDNGRIICVKCAGMSAKFTGRDLSGHKVEKVTADDANLWREYFGEDITCESRCERR